MQALFSLKDAVLFYKSLFCVSLLLVPFRSRWFHLQKSEMVLFVTIAIAKCCIVLGNAITHTVYSYKLSCFFVSICCWVYLVPCGFNSFQVVSVSSNSFQLVFNSFPRFSMYVTRWPPPFSYFRRLKYGITWLSFHAYIYELKTYWMNIKFFNEKKFLNEYNIFEWNQIFWINMKFLNEIIEIDKTTQNWKKI